MPWYLAITLAAIALGGLAFTLLMGYWLQRQESGIETARRSLRYVIVYLLVFGSILTGILLIFYNFLGEKATSIIFNILYYLIIVFILIRFHLKKSNLGNLILDAGMTSGNQVNLVGGIFFAAIAVLVTVRVAVRLQTFIDSDFLQKVEEISILPYYWAFASWFIALGRSGLQLRANGISYLLISYKWNNIKHYYWEQSNRNTLTIWLRKRILFFLPKAISIPVPQDYREEVNEILPRYLPDKYKGSTS